MAAAPGTIFMAVKLIKESASQPPKAAQPSTTKPNDKGAQR